MKMAELKEELRERELPVTGTRSDLVARLCESCGVKPTRGAVRCAAGGEQRPRSCARPAVTAPALGRSRAQPPVKRQKSATSILREQWRAELPTLTMGKSGVGEDPLASVTPTPDGCVKVVAWNVNGLRALLRKEGALQAYVAAEKPDVFCMSETKVSDDWVHTVRSLPHAPHPPAPADPLTATGTAAGGEGAAPGLPRVVELRGKEGYVSMRRRPPSPPVPPTLRPGRQGTRAPPCSPR